MRLPDAERFATLVSVVETGSFRRAAAARHLMPSTVQKQMRSLERQLQIPLFERSGRDIVVLPMAEELALLAADALASSQRLGDHVRRLQHRADSTLHLVSSPLHLARSIGVVTRKFERERNVEVRTTPRPHEQFSDVLQLSAMLRRRECDVMITLQSLEDCHSVPLWTTSLVAVVPADFPQDICDITTLHGCTVFAQSSHVWSRRTLERAAMDAGVDINVVTEPLPGVCISLAQAGLGVAVVADDTLSPMDRAVPLLDVDGVQHSGTIRAHCYAHDPSALTQEFMAFVERHHQD